MEKEKEFWITPPEIYKALDREFNFDFDPCPYPYSGVDGTEVEWGQCTYLNPPFRKSDGKNGKGPTAFIRKAIEENKKGKTVVIMINTNSFSFSMFYSEVTLIDSFLIATIYANTETKTPVTIPLAKIISQVIFCLLFLTLS